MKTMKKYLQSLLAVLAVSVICGGSINAQFDDLYINSLNDKDVEKYLIEHNLFKSVLFSYSNNNTISEFDFSSVEKMEKIVELSEELYKHDQEVFIEIRTEAIRQIQDNHKEISYYKLYIDSFPTITKNELDIITPQNLYYVIDFERIDNDMLDLLINYSKTKIVTVDDYYQFMNLNI